MKPSINLYPWLEHIVEHPELIAEAQKAGKFTPDAWCAFLQDYPNFAKYCQAWEQFKPYHWSALIAKQGDFMQKCEQIGMTSKLMPEDWAWILKSQPELFDKYQKYASHMTFTTFQLRDILSSQPSLISKFNYEKLSSIEMAIVFSKNPTLENEYLKKHSNNWANVPAIEWSYILPERPDLIKHCDINSIPTPLWVSMFKQNKNMFDSAIDRETRNNILNQFNREQFISLIVTRPTMIHEFCKRHAPLTPTEIESVLKRIEKEHRGENPEAQKEAFKNNLVLAICNIRDIPEIQQEMIKNNNGKLVEFYSGWRQVDLQFLSHITHHNQAKETFYFRLNELIKQYDTPDKNTDNMINSNNNINQHNNPFSIFRKVDISQPSQSPFSLTR